MTKTTYLLTGDIGGTNSRMSLYSTDDSCTTDEPLIVKYYRNAEHLPKSELDKPDIFQKNIIVPFLKYCWEETEESSANKLAPLGACQIIACLAIAGVVVENAVRITNLGNLLVDGNAIEQDKTDKYLKHIIICKVINDFVAQGYGCLTLKPNEVKQLHGPKKKEAAVNLESLQGPKVCVGAGTGLGQCYLTPSSDPSATNNNAITYSCFPSEGGHVEYAPKNELEVELWNYLSDKFCSKHRISVERVVSGTGLANVYEFLAHKFPEQIIDQSVHQEFLEAGDEQGRVVGENASKQADNSSSSLFRQAMSIMMSAYGCEVGSAAIKWIPTGGLFVTGGLTPKNIHFIEGHHTDFMLSYMNKGRVSPLLERIPLFAVMTEDLGVRGAHKAAKILYEQRCRGSGGDDDDDDNNSRVLSASWFQKMVQENAVLLAVTAVISFGAGAFFSKSRH